MTRPNRSSAPVLPDANSEYDQFALARFRWIASFYISEAQVWESVFPPILFGDIGVWVLSNRAMTFFQLSSLYYNTANRGTSRPTNNGYFVVNKSYKGIMLGCPFWNYYQPWAEATLPM